MNSKLIEGFFAYPSKADIAEAIRNGISKINETGIVHLKGWESCRVGGKIVIHEICKAIAEAEIFCADLTGLNPNVMFELGFAIARNKRIWLVLDPSVAEMRAKFAKLKILTTVGYSEYCCNSDDLRAKFLREEPWADVGATLFNQCIFPSLPKTPNDSIFYLKSLHLTEASGLVSKEMEKASKAMGVPLIIDDPRETAVQSLAWYGEQAYTARCVVAHLINPMREGADLHNTKFSFVAGLAHGLEKPLLIVAQGEFVAPLDYRDLLKQYQTATEAQRHLHGWLVPIMERHKQKTATQQQYLSSLKLSQQLAELKIGEPIAENEADRLISEYFVETSAYREALDGSQVIFLGRKGAGKTANFLKLASALESDKRNLVCVIKPVAYEMHGIVDLMRRYRDMSVKSYAIESLWKFLVYSEIALSAEAAIKNRPSGIIQFKEKDLIALLDQNSEMLRQDFSVRLERCIHMLLEATSEDAEYNLEKHRASISEVLHSGLLRRLREVLVTALEDKNRVAIILDNLDKAWDKQSDINTLSEFLLGLLAASKRITVDFRAVGPERRTLNLSLAVFLRADIFYRVIALAREPDKIVYTKLNWTDDEMLLRVVEERFSSVLGVAPTEVWTKFFCPSVRDLPTKSYFVSRILKRPRDLLVFVKAAITEAVNRRHGVVREEDVLDAEKKYSQFAVDSILVENGVTVQELENIIYEFLGCQAVVDESRIHSILTNAGKDFQVHASIINHLTNLTFLGLEVQPGEFRFAEDQSESQKNAVLAQHLVQSRPGPARFRINPAFWAFLEVQG